MDSVTQYYNSVSIFDLEFMFLDSGTTYTIEDGQITEVHFAD